MAIIGSYVMKVTLLGSMNGSKTTNRFLHYPLSSRSTPQDFFDDWVANQLDSILGVTSEHQIYNRVIVDEVGPTGALQYQEGMSAPGDVAGEAMGPNIVFSFRKAADNASIEGSNTDPFHLGGVRLTGVPEASQNEGFLSSSAITALNAVGTDLLSGTFGGFTYGLYMERPPLTPSGPPASAAPVAALVISNVLGTQNTRKY